MRFRVECVGASWRVIDMQITNRDGTPRTERWCSTERQARQLCDQLNRERPDAAKEPKCCICGRQPAGGDKDHPRCGVCWSRLANMHG